LSGSAFCTKNVGKKGLAFFFHIGNFRVKKSQ
jgi:hypothetical protein